MNKPFFSVIIPTHNGAPHIKTMLESIRQQTFTDYELIVVCDSCTDDTAEIALPYADRIINTECHRDGLARNAGIDAAAGDWILFADDDDYFVHKYAFEMLADKIKEVGNEFDLIHYSFIWDTRGYYSQSHKDYYSMVWCKAWKRSFIGDLRFDDSKYGSDSNFFDQYVVNNPDCRVYFMDKLLYYYNYKRKGSMTWMMEEGPKAKIDFIITHYNEPWEDGKKLFDSIAIQECVRMNDAGFILVQDGEDNALPWKELLKSYPFRVKVITLKEHSGVSAARNQGLQNSTADFVCFMDFDDMFADIASLCTITRLFPVADDVDVIWSKYNREVNDYGRFQDTTFNCEDQFDFRLIGKMYHREFLMEHNIRFLPNNDIFSDMMFNALVIAETYAFRIRNFYAPFYPFFKKLRRNGYYSTVEALDMKVSGQFDRNVALAKEMKRRGYTARYHEWLVRTIADAYHMLRSTDLEPDESMGITDKLIAFWKKYRNEFEKISDYDIEVAVDASQTEAMSFIQEYYNYFHKEYYLQNDMVSFHDFLKHLDEQCNTESEPAHEPDPEPAVEVVSFAEKEPVVLPSFGKRAVVYCGTKETYINMIASAKSLLATTHVDKVYFLIEDDEFPYPLPEIIETRNVKDTGIFDPNGPNFTNVWTYMCLMRTAFPNMFPQYDKILSLDIDVVITEDVGCLWDIDLDDYYFAGVPEEGRVKESGDDIYANFGVIMMNLKKLRDDGLGDKLIEAVNTEHFGCPEQDAFNKYCRGHIYQLPNDYNVTVYSHITGEPLKERILHYAGLKYWKHFGPVKKYNSLSWDEIMKLQEKTHG